MSPLAKKRKPVPQNTVSALACASRCPMRDMLERKLSVLNDIPRKDIYCLVHDRHSMAVRKWLDKIDAIAAPQVAKASEVPGDLPAHEEPAVAAPYESASALIQVLKDIP